MDGRRATLSIDMDTRMDQALFDQAARLIEEGRPEVFLLQCELRNVGGMLAKALGGRPLPHVKHFAFEHPQVDLLRSDANRLDGANEVLEKMPALRVAVLAGDVRLAPLRHPNLEALALSGPLRKDTLKALASSDLPALRVLLLMSNEMGDADGQLQASPPDYAACLRAPSLAALETVAIEVWDTGLPELLHHAFDAPLGPRLREVDISLRVDGGEEERIVETIRTTSGWRSLGRLGLRPDEILQKTEDLVRSFVPCLHSSVGRWDELRAALG